MIRTETAAIGRAAGLPALLDLVPGSPTAIGYHVVATVDFLGLALWLGPPVYRAILRFRYNLAKRGSAIAFQILFMLAVTMLAVALGFLVYRHLGRKAGTRESIGSFAGET